jgi:hypothetical protein
MKDRELDSARRSRLILLVILTVGVAGGAAADAVIALQRGNTAYGSAVALPQIAAASSPIAASSEAMLEEVLPAEGACSCVDAAVLVKAPSPLGARRGHKRGNRNEAPVRVDLCAMTAALEQ